MNIVTLRFVHVDTYKIERIAAGWRVEFKTFKGDCDKTGEPTLYAALDQDGVHYPAALGNYLEILWEEAAHMEEEETQRALGALGKWITECELATPTIKPFK